ncbi:MAG: UDP-glucose 6-dehydrogenase [SAR86 cluster bacterium]|uniref:UDP-glucose 6-dehydrogenase n=1 Tax=SAR86 cluster bacterium TaxID=2030880 RepID=A0A2A4X4F7_9GAMM|nr:MAG: UDP-glucose 6-dehydrogenase [SAR86 cluster bacterium]
MKVTIFGTGYVGLVTGACFAEVGHGVLCMDIDEPKINLLKNGQIPIYEPGLDTLVSENLGRGNLEFTSDAQQAVKFSDVIIIAVGTPEDEDGAADLMHVLEVAKNIGKEMLSNKAVVIKSTVPVGSADKVRAVIQSALDDRDSQLEIDMVSNPEFLKEGAAIGDFMKPDRIIVGTGSANARTLLQELYAPYNRNSDRLVFMDVKSAELTKYAANAMLATKISFMNEIANLAEMLGADIENVRQGIGSDPRIGFNFIYAGCGYGGSCFPKDVRALSQTAKSYGYEMSILNAVEKVNNTQKTKLVEQITDYYDGDIEGKTFAVWGLSFKPKTSDIREATSRVVIESLWEKGALIQAYDPAAMNEFERVYGQRRDLKLVGTKDVALVNADALIIFTEWQHFRAPNFEILKRELRDGVIFDGRNLYDPDLMREQGITYYGIGRGEAIKKKG